MISELPALVHDTILGFLDVADRVRLGACSKSMRAIYAPGGPCSPRHIVIPLVAWTHTSSVASSVVLPAFSDYVAFIRRFSRKEQKLRCRNLSFGKYWNALETLLDHDSSALDLNISVHFVFLRQEAIRDPSLSVGQDSTLDDISDEFSNLPVQYVMERLMNSIHMTIRLDNDRVLTNEFFMSDEGVYQSYFDYASLPTMVTFRHVYTPIVLGECSIWNCFRGVVESTGARASSHVSTYVSVDLSAPDIVASSEHDLAQCCLEMFIFKCLLCWLAYSKPVQIHWAPTGLATLDSLLKRHLGTPPVPRSTYLVITPVHAY